MNAGNENEQGLEAPDEILALIPWYVAGTLGKRDTRRVAEAAERDPVVARQIEMARDEMAAAAHVNEMVDAPSARSMDRLFAMIDAEQPKARHWGSAFSMALWPWSSGIIPRTVIMSIACCGRRLSRSTSWGRASAHTRMQRCG